MIIYIILRVILADNYDLNDSLFSTPLAMPQLQDRKFQKENAIFKGKGWEEFKEGLLHKNRFFNTGVDTELLKKLFSWAKLTLESNCKYFRARIVSNFDIIQKVEDLLIPAQEILDRCEGRLNPREIGILYITTLPEVAIKETRATFNDKVVIAKGNLTRKIDVIDLSNIINLSPFDMLGTSIAPICQLNKLDLQRIVEDLEQPMQGKRYD